MVSPRSNAALAILAHDVLLHPWLAECVSEAASSLALQGSNWTVGKMKECQSCVCFRVVESHAVGKLVRCGCRLQKGHTKDLHKGVSQSTDRRIWGVAGAGAQQCALPNHD